MATLNNEASKPDLTISVRLEGARGGGAEELASHRVHKLFLKNASLFFKRMLKDLPDTDAFTVEVDSAKGASSFLYLLEHAYGAPNPGCDCDCDCDSVELALKYQFDKYCYDLLIETPGDKYLNDFIIGHEGYHSLCYLNRMSMLACRCELFNNNDERISKHTDAFFSHVHELLMKGINEGRALEYLYKNLDAEAMARFISSGPEEKCWNYDAFMAGMWHRHHSYDVSGFERLIRMVPVQALSKPYRLWWGELINKQNNPALTGDFIKKLIGAPCFPYDKITVTGKFTFTVQQILAQKDSPEEEEEEKAVAFPSGIPYPWLNFAVSYSSLYLKCVEGLTWSLDYDALDHFPMINASIKAHINVLGVALTIDTRPFNTRGLNWFCTEMEDVVEKIKASKLSKDHAVTFAYTLHFEQ